MLKSMITVKKIYLALLVGGIAVLFGSCGIPAEENDMTDPDGFVASAGGKEGEQDIGESDGDQLSGQMLTHAHDEMLGDGIPGVHAYGFVSFVKNDLANDESGLRLTSAESFYATASRVLNASFRAVDTVMAGLTIQQRQKAIACTYFGLLKTAVTNGVVLSDEELATLYSMLFSRLGASSSSVGTDQVETLVAKVKKLEASVREVDNRNKNFAIILAEAAAAKAAADKAAAEEENGAQVFAEALRDIHVSVTVPLSLTAASTSDENVSDSIKFQLLSDEMTCDNSSWTDGPIIDQSSGVITGTPAVANASSSCTIKVEASDGELSMTDEFTVNIYSLALICDPGTDLNTTCEVSTALATQTDGDTIAGIGHLVIKKNGIISSNAAEKISILVDGDVTIARGASIAANLTLLSAANLTIEGDGGVASGLIDVSSLGYAGGLVKGNGGGIGGGVGTWIGGGGGGYGGYGGAGGNTTGSEGAANGASEAAEPVDYGSGGGGGQSTAGGNGGGAIKLIIGETFTNNGQILADGGASPAGFDTGGGGAGGSIWITAEDTLGLGNIRASGGDAGTSSRYGGGGGGGGRIAIATTTYSMDSIISVERGVGIGNGNFGDDGTFALSVENICDSGSVSTTCVISKNKPLANNFSITATGSLSIENGVSIWSVPNQAKINFVIGQNLTFETGANLYGNIASASAKNITVASGASISGLGSGDYGGRYKGFTGKGTGGGTGSGYQAGGGAAHGGIGGDGVSCASCGSTTTYGTNTAPTDFGSGGGGCSGKDGGDGGGVVKMIATDAMVIEGTINMNGGDTEDSYTTGGGGSGGSVWLEANDLSGSGTVSADGGTAGAKTGWHGKVGGGGGGGRIYVEYGVDNFSGTLTVTKAAGGGSGSMAAGSYCLEGGSGPSCS
jgi:hypothetical protein